MPLKNFTLFLNEEFLGYKLFSNQATNLSSLLIQASKTRGLQGCLPLYDSLHPIIKEMVDIGGYVLEARDTLLAAWPLRGGSMRMRMSLP